jgi:hypothetical protein
VDKNHHSYNLSAWQLEDELDKNHHIRLAATAITSSISNCGVSSDELI